MYACASRGTLRALIHTQVDDLLVEHDQSAEVLRFIQKLRKDLHMKDQAGNVIKLRGLTIERKKGCIRLSQPNGTKVLPLLKAEGEADRSLIANGLQE